MTFNTPNDCPAADQRGVPRPQGDACDMGAVEYVNPQPGPNLVVNTLADKDDGACEPLIPGLADCTLREAIVFANSNPDANTITFAVDGVITLQESLTVGNDVIIDGTGRDITIDGDGQHRVLNLVAGDTIPVLDIRSLWIVNGAADNGGGIHNNGGELIVTFVTFQGNQASSDGASIYNAGGAVTVNRSGMRGNSAMGAGGGLYNEGGTAVIDTSQLFENRATTGAAVHNNGGTVTVRKSLVFVNGNPDENTTTFAVDGMITLRESLTVGNDVTIDGSGRDTTHSGDAWHRVLNLVAVNRTNMHGNSATSAGGGLYNEGGTTLIDASVILENRATTGAAVYNNGGTVTVRNSTVSGNTGAVGPGLYQFAGSMTVLNSTVTFNDATVQDGGVFNFEGSIVVRNSILDQNGDANCVLGIINGGNNIDSGESCGWGSENGSLSNTDPLLGPLADNGGSTATHALLPGSPAIDGVTFNAPNDCPAADQRGVTRPQGSACDSGAFELEQSPPPEAFLLNLPVVLANAGQ